MADSIHKAQAIPTRQTGELLVASQQRDFVAALLDTVAALVVVLDRRGRILRFNRACEITTGYGMDEVKDREVWELFLTPDDVALARAAFSQLKPQMFPNHRTTSCQTKSGEQREVEWSSTALLDDDGEVEFIIGTGIDITARHQAEQRLQESEARFRRLAEASFEGIVIHDRGIILDANERFAAMLGYEPEELLGQDGLAKLEPRWQRKHREMVERGHEGPFESVISRRDGSTFPAEIHAKPVPFQGRRVRVAAVRDITERKRAEQELELLLRQEQAARSAAEDAVGLRDEFLSVASHELRTPLASLHLGVQSLLHMMRLPSGQAPDPAVLQRTLEVAGRQTERLSRLVNDLLDVSRLQAGRLVLEREELDLVALAREVLEHSEPQLSAADCPVAYSAGEPVVGRWDRSRLDQVLANLLSNAAKYGASEPVEVTVRAQAGRATVVVRDHGIGIDPARQEQIFERFGRAVSSRHYAGLGLGLYIVRRIVEAHGGTISVDSDLGDGATFTVELPLDAG